MSGQSLVDGFMRGMLSGKGGTSTIRTVPRTAGRVVDVTKDKAYDLLLKLLDPVSANKLYELDNKIRFLSSEISKKTGWTIHGENFVLLDSDDKPFVFHFSDGYEATSSDALRSVEEEFISSNQEELNKLHKAYMMKDAILNGGYTVKEESTSSLAIEIIHFLGVSQEEMIFKKHK